MKSKALLLLVVGQPVDLPPGHLPRPAGHRHDLLRQSGDIPAVNGVSVVSCLLVEDVGTPVADGTVVQFFTTLGRIPEQGKTNDGVVRVNFQSDGRSGQATITAVSGGDAAPPSTTSPTSSTPSTTLPGGGPVRSSGSFPASALSGAGALQNTHFVTVNVGNVNATALVSDRVPPAAHGLADQPDYGNGLRRKRQPAVGSAGVLRSRERLVNLPGPTPVPGRPHPLPPLRRPRRPRRRAAPARGWSTWIARVSPSSPIRTGRRATCCAPATRERRRSGA